MSDRNRHSIQQSIPYGLWPFWGMVLLLLIFAAGCTTLKPATAPTTIDLASAFPVANAIPGWEISQKVESYERADLFNLVDGQADSFFAYGFEQVSAQRYRNSAGTLLNVEIWQLAAPTDAYGLFSTERSGVPANIGNEGDSDPGRRLAFWQDRCFISLEALQPVPDQTLQAFAQAIASRLPKGGERPALVDRLPPSSLVEQSIIFFHEEVSIQTEVWLGGENILGLNQATDGVLGQYQLGDAKIQLMLIEYPTSGQATKGLKALQSGNVAGMVASDVRGALLGAIFGKVTAAQAQPLLQEALK
ncbi:MAG: DUF6599 family protein [Anaerolineales bacterium]|jgi:hypothetical protein